MPNRDFDEVYPTNDELKRFDPRNTAFSQYRKKHEGESLGYIQEETVVDRMMKEIPGFTIVDYAFKNAAETYTGRGFNKGYYSWSSLGVAKKPDSVPRWEVSPDEASKVVTKAAKFYGACTVGFCELDRRWVYSNVHDGRPIVFEDAVEGYETEEKVVIPNSHKYVVAIAVPMEFIENSYAPTTIEVTSNMGYSRMHVTAGSVAEFIRGLGWYAIPCGNDTALSVPIAIQAGLGHQGRNGRLITWENGPLVRLCKVFTDMPLAPSPPAPEGIIEYCEVCKKCARACPSGSIPMGSRAWEGPTEANQNGSFKWYCDEEKCFEYWHEVGTGCSICFRVCSFTKQKGFIHDVIKWFIRNVPQLNRFWAYTDDLLGYGKMSDPKEYWDKPYEPS
ncbi:MAG TPA: reductive dehalogenase [Patescibacteria group bacterium]|nr:reductive dehalogenase [Patescibacteria group bacterium]